MHIFLSCIQFSIFYIGGLVVILSCLVLYNLKLVPEGGTDQSVFSIGYWYNYGHSLYSVSGGAVLHKTKI